MSDAGNSEPYGMSGQFLGTQAYNNTIVAKKGVKSKDFLTYGIILFVTLYLPHIGIVTLNRISYA